MPDSDDTRPQKPPEDLEKRAIITNEDWLMRVRLNASQRVRNILTPIEASGDTDSETAPKPLEPWIPIISGVLEDLRSASAFFRDAAPNLARAYIESRPPGAAGQADEGMVSLVLDAIGDAIAEEEGLDGDDIALYRTGFICGMAAVLRHITVIRPKE
jgi:hypothetical protein